MTKHIDFSLSSPIISPDIAQYQNDKKAMFDFIKNTQEFKQAFISGKITPEWLLQHWRIRMEKVHAEGFNGARGSITWEIHII